LRVTGVGPLVVEERVAWWAVLALPAVVPLVVGTVPFTSSGSYTQNPFVYPKIVAFALLVAISSASWAYGVLRGTIGLRTVPGGWWLAGFLGLATLSTAFAMSPSMAFFGGKYQRVGLMVMLLAAAAFVLAVQLMTSAGRMRSLAWSTVGAGVVAAALVLLQSRGIDPLSMSRDNPIIFFRGPSLLGNPDFTGTYLVVPTVLAAALALSAPALRARLMAWGCFGVTLLAVLVSLTRGAWVGVTVGVGVLIILAARSQGTKKSAMLLVAGLATVLALAVAVEGPATFGARFSDLTSATTAGDSRFVLWGEALTVVRQHPLFGTGPDSYPLGWYGARSPTTMRLTGIETVIDDPHNYLLLLIATLGIPAGLLGVGILAMPLVRTARAALARDATHARLMYAGWWAALLGLTAALVFGANVVALTMMLAIGIGVLLAPRAADVLTPPSVWRPLIAGMAACTLIILVLSGISLAADVRLRGAKASGDLAAIGAAAGTAPWHAEAQYLAAYGYATDAVALLVQGAPGAKDALIEADMRLNTLIRREPHEYSSQVLKALYLTQRGAVEGTATFELARSAAEKALDIYPLSPVAAFLKALNEANLGNKQAALATLEPLWDIDPRYSEAGVLYVQLLAERGQRDRAQQALATLKTRFPSSVEVQKLAQSLEATGTAQ
jgi:O-antigen ligase